MNKNRFSHECFYQIWMYFIINFILSFNISYACVRIKNILGFSVCLTTVFEFLCWNTEPTMSAFTRSDWRSFLKPVKMSHWQMEVTPTFHSRYLLISPFERYSDPRHKIPNRQWPLPTTGSAHVFLTPSLETKTTTITI